MPNECPCADPIPYWGSGKRAYLYLICIMIFKGVLYWKWRENRSDSGNITIEMAINLHDKVTCMSLSDSFLVGFSECLVYKMTGYLPLKWLLVTNIVVAWSGCYLTFEFFSCVIFFFRISVQLLVLFNL